jgi:hypothetical protein
MKEKEELWKLAMKFQDEFMVPYEDGGEPYPDGLELLAKLNRLCKLSGEKQYFSRLSRLLENCNKSTDVTAYFSENIFIVKEFLKQCSLKKKLDTVLENL